MVISALALTNPIIYRNPVSDVSDLTILTRIYDRNGSLPYEIRDPESRNFSTLDSMLNGRDIIIVGGPRANSVALGFQQNLQSIWTGTSVTQLSLSPPNSFLDGSGFDNAAPSLSVTTSSSSFSHTRTLLNSGTKIQDYAVLAQFSGTTNKLIYVAGIRDFGTAFALFVLDWKERSAAPGNVVDDSTRNLWKAVLATSNPVVMSFKIPVSMNSTSLSSFVNYMDTNGTSNTGIFEWSLGSE